MKAGTASVFTVHSRQMSHSIFTTFKFALGRPGISSVPKIIRGNIGCHRASRLFVLQAIAHNCYITNLRTHTHARTHTQPRVCAHTPVWHLSYPVLIWGFIIGIPATLSPRQHPPCPCYSTSSMLSKPISFLKVTHTHTHKLFSRQLIQAPGLDVWDETFL